ETLRETRVATCVRAAIVQDGRQVLEATVWGTDDWENRAASEPEQWSWFRFVDGASFDDPWLDGTRLLMVTDLDAWGAATNAHSGELEWFAPTIELTCRFLQPATEHEWLLSWGSAPVGRDALIGVVSETWSDDGQLLATGGSTLLCRPAPQRPDR
ncbi:MAG: acyl-CoA thioesterase-2, partial [Candidatus Aldehydirespiratoraceae bacterium]